MKWISIAVICLTAAGALGAVGAFQRAVRGRDDSLGSIFRR